MDGDLPDGVENVTFGCATTGFDVDWGDHSAATHTANLGGPYPRGDVTHVYEVVGYYSVRVTSHWNCNWTQAGVPGSGAATRAGVLADFPVSQIQAVIDG